MRIKDFYFEKGHFWLKLHQTLIGAFMWLLVAAPIAITLNSIYFRINYLPRWQYLEGFHLYDVLNQVLRIALGSALLLSVILTVRNNLIIKKKARTEILYDETKVAQKLELTEKVYENRFGSLSARHGVKTYSVKEAQNFEDDFFVHLYEEGVVQP